MVTNELLEAKYQAQRRLNEQAGRDLRAYAKKVHEVVQAVEKKHGLKFRYEPVKKKVASSANTARKDKDVLTFVAPEAVVGA